MEKDAKYGQHTCVRRLGSGDRAGTQHATKDSEWLLSKAFLGCWSMTPSKVQKWQQTHR